METITIREVVAVGLRLLSVALLIGAAVLTSLVMTVAPLSDRVVLILLLIFVAPLVGAMVIWQAANRI